MSDHQAHGRAAHDRSDEEPRPARRRRPAADWGVGEELFEHMPSRRFARRGEEHRIPRGGADDGRRTIVIERDDAESVVLPEPAEDEAFASREEALRAREEHDALWAGDEPFAPPAPADEAPAPVEEREPAEPVADTPTAEIVRGGVDGRRTVKIGGRPGEFYAPSERRRPPKPVHERLGARPDRIAAWAFALGMLLIVIAILSQ